MFISGFDLDQKILRALESGPKTVVAIKLFLEVREKNLFCDHEIPVALCALVAAGLCDAVDLDEVSGLSEIDLLPRVGPAMLYSVTLPIR